MRDEYIVNKRLPEVSLLFSTYPRHYIIETPFMPFHQFHSETWNTYTRQYSNKATITQLQLLVFTNKLSEALSTRLRLTNH